MPVHLTGRVSEMKKILQISKKYKLPIIEDCAQSIGSKYMNKSSGSFGNVGCFSAHPLKNLNAIGDAGYLVTNNKDIYKKIKDLRNHGMTNRDKIKSFGYVSRMDNLQAAILNYRLKNLDEVIKARRSNVDFYKKNLNSKIYIYPRGKKYEFNTYHTFVIQVSKRDRLKKFLNKHKIGTAIHYPIPIHLQPACKKFSYRKGDFPETEKQADRILTLPINQFLRNSELKYIVEKVNSFMSKKINPIFFENLIKNYNLELDTKLRGFNDNLDYLKYWVPGTDDYTSVINLIDALYENSNLEFDLIFNKNDKKIELVNKLEKLNKKLGTIEIFIEENL